MTFDPIYLINTMLLVLGGVSMYLFKGLQDHEKRVQRIEDVYALEVEKLSKHLEEVKKELHELTKYVHQKMHDDVNRQEYTNKLIDLMYKKMLNSED